MSQTKFVLTKALAQKLKPIVVINKMDRHDQRADEVEAEVLHLPIHCRLIIKIFDLFAALDATDDQMNYPTLFASARSGWAVRNKNDEKKDLSALFDAILERGSLTL
jgi:GTP-binding protein